MSGSSLSANIDVAQLVQNIREQIGRRTEPSNIRSVQAGVEDMIPAQLIESLRSTSDETEALSSQVQSGEPSPASLTLRKRVGSLVKRRLNGFLWWQSYQIRTLVALTARRGREELKLVDALSQSIRQLSQELLEAKRQAHDNETRLRQLESAQLRLQAAEIERNVRAGTAQLEAERASLHQELSGVKDALNLAEARLADQILHGDATSSQRIGELARRIETEIGEKEQLAARLSELTQRVEADASRLSELGLFTHQTRTSLSLQDRRLALFIEEARKRLPEPFTDDQLHNMIKSQTDHRYDSLYVAFEDVFRGSRDEIKARQSVYLSFLKEHGIGSTAMPILDLGCGRGEWLELLNEHGLKARGVDRNETMIEHCKSSGLEVINGDAVSYLGAQPDSSLGAVTSFHMIEHLPFEVTLTLVDEALRVLKPGGILILETPNPQNILVGAHTFHLDPTHLKPLPSPMLRFFVEARGFCDAHVRELHPYPETVRFPDDGRGVANRLNDYLYGPQDYAVIGRKP